MPLSLVESFDVPHSLDTVWSHVRDVDFVAACFPGASLDEPAAHAVAASADGQPGYSGIIRLKLGPTAVTFRGVLYVSFDDATHAAVLDAKGDDARRTKASAKATVRVEAVDADRTRITSDAQIEVVGALAQFAKAGGVEITRLILKDFAVNFDRRLRTEQQLARAEASGAAPVNQSHDPAPARTELSALRMTGRLIAATFLRLFGRRRRTGDAAPATTTSQERAR